MTGTGYWLYSTGSVPVDAADAHPAGAFSTPPGRASGWPLHRWTAGRANSAPLFRGAARIAGEAGQDAGYLVITLTRADFQRLLEGTYGGQERPAAARPVLAARSTPARPPWPAAWLSSLREQLLAGEALSQEGEEYAYRRGLSGGDGAVRRSSSGPRL